MTEEQREEEEQQQLPRLSDLTVLPQRESSVPRLMGIPAGQEGYYQQLQAKSYQGAQEPRTIQVGQQRGARVVGQGLRETAGLETDTGIDEQYDQYVEQPLERGAIGAILPTLARGTLRYGIAAPWGFAITNIGELGLRSSAPQEMFGENLTRQWESGLNLDRLTGQYLRQHYPEQLRDEAYNGYVVYKNGYPITMEEAQREGVFDEGNFAHDHRLIQTVRRLSGGLRAMQMTREEAMRQHPNESIYHLEPTPQREEAERRALETQGREMDRSLSDAGASGAVARAFKWVRDYGISIAEYEEDVSREAFPESDSLAGRTLLYRDPTTDQLRVDKQLPQNMEWWISRGLEPLPAVAFSALTAGGAATAGVRVARAASTMASLEGMSVFNESIRSGAPPMEALENAALSGAFSNITNTLQFNAVFKNVPWPIRKSLIQRAGLKMMSKQAVRATAKPFQAAQQGLSRIPGAGVARGAGKVTRPVANLAARGATGAFAEAAEEMFQAGVMGEGLKDALIQGVEAMGPGALTTMNQYIVQKQVERYQHRDDYDAQLAEDKYGKQVSPEDEYVLSRAQGVEPEARGPGEMGRQMGELGLAYGEGFTMMEPIPEDQMLAPVSALAGARSEMIQRGVESIQQRKEAAREKFSGWQQEARYRRMLPYEAEAGPRTILGEGFVMPIGWKPARVGLPALWRQAESPYQFRWPRHYDAWNEYELWQTYVSDPNNTQIFQERLMNAFRSRFQETDPQARQDALIQRITQSMQGREGFQSRFGLAAESWQEALNEWNRFQAGIYRPGTEYFQERFGEAFREFMNDPQGIARVLYSMAPEEQFKSVEEIDHSMFVQNMLSSVNRAAENARQALTEQQAERAPREGEPAGPVEAQTEPSDLSQEGTRLVEVEGPNGEFYEVEIAEGGDGEIRSQIRERRYLAPDLKFEAAGNMVRILGNQAATGDDLAISDPGQRSRYMTWRRNLVDPQITDQILFEDPVDALIYRAKNSDAARMLLMDRLDLPKRAVDQLIKDVHRAYREVEQELEPEMETHKEDFFTIGPVAETSTAWALPPDDPGPRQTVQSARERLVEAQQEIQQLEALVAEEQAKQQQDQELLTQYRTSLKQAQETLYSANKDLTTFDENEKASVDIGSEQMLDREIMRLEQEERTAVQQLPEQQRARLESEKAVNEAEGSLEAAEEDLKQARKEDPERFDPMEQLEFAPRITSKFGKPEDGAQKEALLRRLAGEKRISEKGGIRLPNEPVTVGRAHGFGVDVLTLGNGQPAFILRGAADHGPVPMSDAPYETLTAMRDLADIESRIQKDEAAIEEGRPIAEERRAQYEQSDIAQTVQANNERIQRLRDLRQQREATKQPREDEQAVPERSRLEQEAAMKEAARTAGETPMKVGRAYGFDLYAFMDGDQPSFMLRGNSTHVGQMSDADYGTLQRISNLARGITKRRKQAQKDVEELTRKIAKVEKRSEEGGPSRVEKLAALRTEADQLKRGTESRPRKGRPDFTSNEAGAFLHPVELLSAVSSWWKNKARRKDAHEGQKIAEEVGGVPIHEKVLDPNKRDISATRSALSDIYNPTTREEHENVFRHAYNLNLADLFQGQRIREGLMVINKYDGKLRDQKDREAVRPTLEALYAGDKAAVEQARKQNPWIVQTAQAIKDLFKDIRKRVINWKVDMFRATMPARTYTAWELSKQRAYQKGIDPRDAASEVVEELNAEAKTEGYRKVDLADVLDAIDEFERIAHWGIDDYVTNIERGYIHVLDQDGTTRAMATTVHQARKRARALLEEQAAAQERGEELYGGEIREVQIRVGRTMPNFEQVEGGKPAKWHLEKILKANLDEYAGQIANSVRRDIARTAAALTVKAAPTQVFSGPMQHRRNILKGEPDLLSVMPMYLHAIERKMALDPVIMELQNDRHNLPPRARAYLDDIVERLKGRYSVWDQATDELLMKTKGFVDELAGTNWAERHEMGAATRASRHATNIQRTLKLKWRPMAWIVNRLGGETNIIGQRGIKLRNQGAALWKDAYKHKKGPIWELLESVHYRGALGVEVGIDLAAKGVPGDKLYHGMYMFKQQEKAIREIGFITNYLYAKSQNMSEYAAIEDAIQNTHFQAFLYNSPAIPYYMDNPGGRTFFQFKTYIFKQMQFLRSLTLPQLARYLTMTMMTSGVNGGMVILKSIPLLDMTTGGLLDDLDELLQTAHAVAGDYTGRALGIEGMLNAETGARLKAGLPGLLGADISASVTPQIALDYGQWAGPFLSDSIKLYRQIQETVQSRGANLNFREPLSLIQDYSPLAYYWNMLWESFVDPNGWIRDERGNRLYRIPGWEEDSFNAVYKRALLTVGAQPVEMRQMRKDVSAQRAENRQRAMMKSILTSRIARRLAMGQGWDNSAFDQLVEMTGGDVRKARESVERRLENAQLPPIERILEQTPIPDRPAALRRLTNP